MALFHLSVTQTKRSAGQSAIASAAYRAGARFKIQGVKKLLFYCNRDGMFSLTLN